MQGQDGVTSSCSTSYRLKTLHLRPLEKLSCTKEMLSVKKELSIVRLENAELKKGQELMTKKLEELKAENRELNALRVENAELKTKLNTLGYGEH